MSGTRGAAVSSTEDSPAGSRFRFRWWHFAVLLLAIVVVFVLIRRWHWKREFRQRIAAIAAAGYPATTEELDAWYRWPAPGENAAGWILDAGDRLTKPPQKDYDRLWTLIRYPGELPTGDPLSEDARQLMVRHVEANREALQLLHEGATVEESRYPIDLSDGFESLLPHLSVYRDAHYLLCFEALTCMEAGDPNGAARAIQAALGVTHSLDHEPTVISQGVRLRSQVTILGILERLLCRQTLAEPQLQALETAVQDAYVPEALKRALVGERCMIVHLFAVRQLPSSNLRWTSSMQAVLEVYSALGLTAREGTRLLDTAEEFIQALQLPPLRRQEAIERATLRLDACTKRSMMLFEYSHLSAVVAFEIEYIASVRTALVALAAERFRLRPGRWPETLSELVPQYLPDVPDDPFDGAPLRYRCLEAGFAVYSVGEDRGDDGGRPLPPPKERQPGETYDITFAVRR